MLIRRLIQLYIGLILYGLSMALMIRADLGLDPWDSFHQGLSKQIDISFGIVVNVVGLIVLLMWIPLRQRPGIGTVSNIIVIGTVADIGLALISSPASLIWSFAMLTGGIVLNGIAGAAYIGAGLGPGPRDGLMTGFVARTGLSIRLVRTTIELTVLAAGWLLGGTIGFGTVAYAVSIGWLTQIFLPRFTIRQPVSV